MPKMIQDLFDQYAEDGEKVAFLDGVWEIVRYRKGFGLVADAIRQAVTGVQAGYASASAVAQDSLDLMGVHPSNEDGMFAFYPAGNLEGNVVTLYGWGHARTLTACRGLHRTDEFTHAVASQDHRVPADAVPLTALAKLALVVADELQWEGVH